MVISASAAYYGYTAVMELQTSIGQIGRLISPELRARYAEAQRYLYGGVIGLIIGLGLTIYGAAAGRPEMPKIVTAKPATTRPKGYELVPPQPQPIEVEILPEAPQPKASLKPVTIEQLMSSKVETLKLLENLDKGLIEGRISEETYKKLRKELEEKLRQVDTDLKEKVEIEIGDLCVEISKDEANRESMKKSLEELKSRQLIGQLKKKEYEQRKVTIEKEIEKIAAQISSKQKRMQELQELIRSKQLERLERNIKCNKNLSK
ncbi:MAG: hypothetical protein ACUVTD_08935, partial [Nitrososphaerales archaeon]